MSGAPVLPARTRDYLAHPALADVWKVIRAHLERRGLAAIGRVTVDLDAVAADRLNGLVGARGPRWRPGRRQVDLAALDGALRSSAAATGLVAAVAELTGSPLVDKRADRAARHLANSDLWAAVDDALAGAGLAGASWAAEFTEGLRRSGLLTRAGTDAPRLVAEAGAVLSALELRNFDGVSAGRTERAREERHKTGVGQISPVELAALATRTTGDAHGLDEGRVTPRVVLRAAALAHGLPTPASAAERRQMWTLLGVVPDQVSGTVLTWALRPPGDGAWAVAMRARAELGLVTHLTLQELGLIGALDPSAAVPLVETGLPVWACENPQVVQSAARAQVPGALICTSGNPSGAAWQLLRALTTAGVEVRYHGDFDWPGVAIAGRLFDSGVTPWRMGATDYEEAVEAVDAEPLALSGAPCATPWDPRLEAAMQRHQTAVHEEALTDILIGDLSRGCSRGTK